MQTKLDSVKNKVEQFLNKKNIKFTVVSINVESDDLKQSHNGYTFETDSVVGSVIPNYKKNKVEFLLLNQNLLEHLITEGYTDEEIQESGKIWIHVTKLANFQKVFELAASETNLK